MARLGAHLRYFVRKKIAEDTAWQRPHVIFSGESAQLEGDIMRYVCTKHALLLVAFCYMLSARLPAA